MRRTRGHRGVAVHRSTDTPSDCTCSSAGRAKVPATLAAGLHAAAAAVRLPPCAGCTSAPRLAVPAPSEQSPPFHPAASILRISNLLAHVPGGASPPMDVMCIVFVGFAAVTTVTMDDERAMLAAAGVFECCPCMQAHSLSHRRLFDFLATSAINRDAGCAPGTPPSYWIRYGNDSRSHGRRRKWITNLANLQVPSKHIFLSDSSALRMCLINPHA